MVRLGWLLAGGVLALVGGDLMLRSPDQASAWLVAGVGGGIVFAVIGSLLHDILVRPRR